MTTAQERLKEDIENITDEAVIEKVRIFIRGILTQQSLEEGKPDRPVVSGEKTPLKYLTERNGDE